MDDKKTPKNEFKEELDEKEIDYYVNYDERKHPIILIFLTTFAVLFALGISFSAINFISGDQTINTLISIIKKDDDKKDDDNNKPSPKPNNDKDKYIITYIEKNSTTENGIYLINQFPTKDEVGKLFKGESYVYEFSLLVGSKTAGVYYELTAVPDKNNTLDPSYVKLYLQKNDNDVEFSYKPNNKIKVFTDYKDSKYNEVSGKVIYQGEVSPNDVKNKKINFVMRMWVSEDAKVDENFSNKTFSVKVNTYARTAK